MTCSTSLAKTTSTDLDLPQISPSCCSADAVRLIKPSAYKPRGKFVDVPGSTPPLKAYVSLPVGGVGDETRAVLSCYDVIGWGHAVGGFLGKRKFGNLRAVLIFIRVPSWLFFLGRTRSRRVMCLLILLDGLWCLPTFSGARLGYVTMCAVDHVLLYSTP